MEASQAGAFRHGPDPGDGRGNGRGDRGGQKQDRPPAPVSETALCQLPDAQGLEPEPRRVQAGQAPRGFIFFRSRLAQHGRCGDRRDTVPAAQSRYLRHARRCRLFARLPRQALPKRRAQRLGRRGADRSSGPPFHTGNAQPVAAGAAPQSARGSAKRLNARRAKAAADSARQCSPIKTSHSS